LTGISNLNAQLGPKRLELLRELAPGANEIGLLVNPANIGSKEMVRDTRAAAEKLRVRIHVSNASVDSDLDGVFESLERLKLRALLVATDGFLIRSGRRLGELGLRHGVPTVFQTSEFAAAGGLVSYGGVLREAYHQVGVYAARILKGEKPAELPVQQSTKAEMIINLKTAKALGINVPLPLLGRADEVIE
jgi:putative ABC transport system substrate-binding protein